MDVATLRSVPLFASLDSKATAELGKYLTIHDYPKSATIFRYGDPGDAMYLIDVGKVRISVTDADRAADRIAEFGGSWKFIILSIVLFGVWVAANTILLTRRPFDPYPFILLNLALNMITALQAPIIMMSQNRQAHKDRLRANLDYQVNLKNELLLSDIIRRLDEIEKRKRE